jgi:hypothetical protein
VSTFRINQSQNIVKRLGLLVPEDGGTTSLRNVGNFTSRGGVTSQHTIFINVAVQFLVSATVLVPGAASHVIEWSS